MKPPAHTKRNAPREGERHSHGRAPHDVPPPPVRPGYYKGNEYSPESSVGLLMRRVVEMISRALDQRMEVYGLTDAQWRPLISLAWEGEAATATKIARRFGCDTGATTRMLDRLEDKGLLRRVRSTDDRRVQQLELTDEGRRAAAVVPYVIADVLNAHLADLSRAEVDQLRSLLERVLAAGQREHDHLHAEEPK